jgi:hypothetical protein
MELTTTNYRVSKGNKKSGEAFNKLSAIFRARGIKSFCCTEIEAIFADILEFKGDLRNVCYFTVKFVGEAFIVSIDSGSSVELPCAELIDSSEVLRMVNNFRRGVVKS